MLEQGREEETKCVPGRETMNKNSGVRKDIKIRNNCGVGCLQFGGSVGDGMRHSGEGCFHGREVPWSLNFILRKA